MVFLAVSWTDLAQGLLMAAALVVVPLMVIALQGGPDVALAGLKASHPDLLDPMTSAAGEPLDLVAYAWAGFGAAFGPVILLSLYWPRMSRAAALAGMITGGLTVWGWKTLEGGWFDLYELLPAFLASLFVSLVGQQTRDRSGSTTPTPATRPTRFRLPFRVAP